jgi:hypothetical protein
MSHANPSGDLAVVVERALDELNDRLQSRRFAQAKSARALGSETQGLDPVPARVHGAARPEAHTAESPHRTATPSTNIDPWPADSTKRCRLSHPKTERRRAHVRHDVRRAVLARDGQRCGFVGEDGHRCEARSFLQFHHQRALGAWWRRHGGKFEPDVPSAQSADRRTRARGRTGSECGGARPVAKVG